MGAYNAMWLPGTDHAGIATQMVVERELKAPRARRATTSAARSSSSASGSGRRRTAAASSSSSRCSAPRCDWERERFTMDERTVARRCAEAFVRALRRRAHLPRAAAHQLVPDAAARRCRISRSSTTRTRKATLSSSPIRCRRLERAADRRHDAPRDDARRHRGGRAPRRSALQQAGSARRSSCRSTGRKIPIIADAMLVDIEVRHRRGEGDAGARLQRLRDRPAPQARR